MHASDSRVLGATPDHLPDPARRHAPHAPDPQPRLQSERMPRARPEVAVKRLDGLGPEGQEPMAPALAENADRGPVEVDVALVVFPTVEPDARELGQPGAGVDEGA